MTLLRVDWGQGANQWSRILAGIQGYANTGSVYLKFEQTAGFSSLTLVLAWVEI